MSAPVDDDIAMPCGPFPDLAALRRHQPCEWCDAFEARWLVRALAAGLLGVCWGMAADARSGRADSIGRYPWRNEKRRYYWEAGGDRARSESEIIAWLLDQARPPGCRAPWETP